MKMSRIKSPVSQDGRHIFQTSRYIFHSAHHFFVGVKLNFLHRIPPPDLPPSSRAGLHLQFCPFRCTQAGIRTSAFFMAGQRRGVSTLLRRYGFPGFFTKKNDNHPRIQGFRELLAPNSMLGTPGAHSGPSKKNNHFGNRGLPLSCTSTLSLGGRRWCCNRTC